MLAQERSCIKCSADTIVTAIADDKDIEHTIKVYSAFIIRLRSFMKVGFNYE